MAWEYWYNAGKTAAKLGLGILIYSGPSEFDQAWTRGYIAFLSENLTERR